MELRRVLIGEPNCRHRQPDLLAAFTKHAMVPVRRQRVSG
jgi:hypothetical protein